MRRDDVDGIRSLYGLGAPLVWGEPIGYVTSSDSTARVVYRGHDDQIHELFNPAGVGWGHASLSALTGAPSADHDPLGFFNAAPFAYSTPNNGTARVIYRGDDEHIHELWYTTATGWGHGDLSALSGAAPAASDPFGYFTAFDSTARVIYRGHDNHIHELYYTSGGSWGSADLTP